MIRLATAFMVIALSAPSLRAAARIAPAATTPAETVNWTAGVSYTYDGSGNIRQIGNDRFAYDLTGRLVQADINSVTRTYQYDAFGNRTGCTHMPGTGSLSDCQFGIGIEPASNRMKDVGYDRAGNVETFAGHRYTYDEANMVKRDDGPRPREFVYTAADERIAVHEVGRDWTWSIRDFENKVVREFTSDSSLSTWTWKRDHVFRGGLLLASRHVANETPVTYHYHLDHLGTPRRITDHNNRTVGFHDFFAFGPEVTGGLTEAFASSLRYTGHERDELSPGSLDTLDYMHARYYSPVLGRFMSTDPGKDSERRKPQSWNMYAYVRNNPVNALDPTGKWIELSQKGNSSQVREFLIRTVMRSTGRTLVQSMGQSTSFGVVMEDHRINPPVYVNDTKRAPSTYKFLGGTFAPDWTHDASGRVTGATGGKMLIDTLAVSKVHPDRTGVTTTGHEFFHATGAQQGLSPADLRAQDTTGSADAFGQAVSNEASDITRQEAEKIVDDLLSGRYKPPPPKPAGACIEGQPACR